MIIALAAASVLALCDPTLKTCKAMSEVRDTAQDRALLCSAFSDMLKSDTVKFTEDAPAPPRDAAAEMKIFNDAVERGYEACVSWAATMSVEAP